MRLASHAVRRRLVLAAVTPLCFAAWVGPAAAQPADPVPADAGAGSHATAPSPPVVHPDATMNASAPASPAVHPHFTLRRTEPYRAIVHPDVTLDRTAPAAAVASDVGAPAPTADSDSSVSVLAFVLSVVGAALLAAGGAALITARVQRGRHHPA